MIKAVTVALIILDLQPRDNQSLGTYLVPTIALIRYSFVPYHQHGRFGTWLQVKNLKCLRVGFGHVKRCIMYESGTPPVNPVQLYGE